MSIPAWLVNDPLNSVVLLVQGTFCTALGILLITRFLQQGKASFLFWLNIMCLPLRDITNLVHPHVRAFKPHHTSVKWWANLMRSAVLGGADILGTWQVPWMLLL